VESDIPIAVFAGSACSFLQWVIRALGGLEEITFNPDLPRNRRKSLEAPDHRPLRRLGDWVTERLLVDGLELPGAFDLDEVAFRSFNRGLSSDCYSAGIAVMAAPGFSRKFLIER